MCGVPVEPGPCAPAGCRVAADAAPCREGGDNFEAVEPPVSVGASVPRSAVAFYVNQYVTAVGNLRRDGESAVR